MVARQAVEPQSKEDFQTAGQVYLLFDRRSHFESSTLQHSCAFPSRNPQDSGILGGWQATRHTRNGMVHHNVATAE